MPSSSDCNFNQSPFVSPELYFAGRCVFRFTGKDRALLDQVKGVGWKVLPPELSLEAEVVEIDLRGPIRRALKTAVMTVIGHHSRLMYLEGAVLRSATGRLLLLAGQSRSGKSTLAVTLISKHRWHLVSEDIVFFSGESQERLLTLCLPVHLRSGTSGLIGEGLGVQVPDLPGGCWFFDGENFVSEPDVAADLFSCVLLSGSAARGAEMETGDLDCFSFMRRLLPMSNALEYPHGPEAILEAIRNAHCVELSGGTIAQRVDAVESLICRQ